MPNLPDIPGKDLIDGTARRARAIASGAGTAALAVGGFVIKRLLGGRGDGDDERPEPGFVATPTDAGPSAVPTGEGRRTARKRKPAPTPKAAKPKPTKPELADPPKPKPHKPRAAKPPKPKADKPKAAKPPTVPGAEPGDQRGGKDPHHALNNPVTDPDPTEYPDPFDKREDPREPVDPEGAPFGEQPHPPTGSESTSEPPPAEDPEVGDRARPPRRENLDD